MIIVGLIMIIIGCLNAISEQRKELKIANSKADYYLQQYSKTFERLNKYTNGDSVCLYP
jgi:uncharacterized membrane protein YukC